MARLGENGVKMILTKYIIPITDGQSYEAKSLYYVVLQTNYPNVSWVFAQPPGILETDLVGWKFLYAHTNDINSYVDVIENGYLPDLLNSKVGNDLNAMNYTTITLPYNKNYCWNWLTKVPGAVFRSGSGRPFN